MKKQKVLKKRKRNSRQKKKNYSNKNNKKEIDEAIAIVGYQKLPDFDRYPTTYEPKQWPFTGIWLTAKKCFKYMDLRHRGKK